MWISSYKIRSALERGNRVSATEFDISSLDGTRVLVVMFQGQLGFKSLRRLMESGPCSGHIARHRMQPRWAKKETTQSDK